MSNRGQKWNIADMFKEPVWKKKMKIMSTLDSASFEDWNPFSLAWITCAKHVFINIYCDFKKWLWRNTQKLVYKMDCYGLWYVNKSFIVFMCWFCFLNLCICNMWKFYSILEYWWIHTWLRLKKQLVCYLKI